MASGKHPEEEMRTGKRTGDRQAAHDPHDKEMEPCHPCDDIPCLRGPCLLEKRDEHEDDDESGAWPRE